ncbi:AAA family ATPase [Luteimonas huabeiensis]|uniref:AAA family ATPase n=1 Tax=Luteimonas huabeiensis TaxID=1244513 RepID=UPI0004662420|nr:AAA family ATPase [Luteimonas huabeiensis]
MARILALAGVNGAGKSSLLGAMLREDGIPWFNPDSFTHALVRQGWPPAEANAEAWQEGRRRLERALADGHDHVFETTLGGNTLPALLRQACAHHEVAIWFCGLSSVDLHLERVAARVARGGHDIPEARIRQRYDAARANLIDLIPHLAALHVHDNSRPADADGHATPLLVLDMDRDGLRYPRAIEELAQVPDWAKPIVMAALRARGR